MASDIPSGMRNRLALKARSAAAKAYAPYSKFRVGAAVLGASGKIYSGCNVENASFGLCNCAERTAVFTAICAGEAKIRAVAVYAETDRPVLPCGACRQVIYEFGPDALVISAWKSEERLEVGLGALLPAGFGPDHLKPGERKSTGRRKAAVSARS